MENTSGIYPYDLKVLVKPVKMERKTAGGIIIPDETGEKDDQGTLIAQIIAVGSNAFYEVKESKYRPQVGQYIAYSAYAGYLIVGKDEEHYRVINDNDVTAILDGVWDVRVKALKGRKAR